MELLGVADSICIFRLLLHNWALVIFRDGTGVKSFLYKQTLCFPKGGDIHKDLVLHMLPFVTTCGCYICFVMKQCKILF